MNRSIFLHVKRYSEQHSKPSRIDYTANACHNNLNHLSELDVIIKLNKVSSSRANIVADVTLSTQIAL